MGIFTKMSVSIKNPPNTPQGVLQRYWKYPDFRSGQAEVIEAVLAGQDSMVVIPTGGGKSLCYQVPALLLDGITLVISPLISLMQDQVMQLKRRGIGAAALNSTLGEGEATEIYRQAARREIKLLYAAPERFELGGAAERLRQIGVSLLAIDEAHCISQWGHDFRPSYRTLALLRQKLGGPPLIALTATATPAVQKDITRDLGLRQPTIVVRGFDRPNINFKVISTGGGAARGAQLADLVKQEKGSVIVYATTRKMVDETTLALVKAGISASGYHAGLESQKRRKIQDRFIKGKERVLVATNAFGMGIDKPDIRLVVHAAMPGTLESYYQEAGRAGRDGLPAKAVLLAAYADRFTHEFLISTSYPERQVVEQIHKVLQESAGPTGIVRVLPDEIAAKITSKPQAVGSTVMAAIKFLATGGVCLPLDAAPVSVIRLLIEPKEIRSRFADEHDPNLILLRQIWKQGGGRLTQGCLVRVDLLNGDTESINQGIADLAASGLISAAKPSGSAWIPPAGFGTKTPLDWAAWEAHRSREISKLNAIQQYVYAKECRRQIFLRYFGDQTRNQLVCQGCDICGDPNKPASSLKVKASPKTLPVAKAKGKSVGAANKAKLTKGGVSKTRQLKMALDNWRMAEAKKRRLTPGIILPDEIVGRISRQPPQCQDDLDKITGLGQTRLKRYGPSLWKAIEPFIDG